MKFRPLGWEGTFNGRTCRVVPVGGIRLARVKVVQVYPRPRKIITVVRDSDAERALQKALRIAADWLENVPAGAPAM